MTTGKRYDEVFKTQIAQRAMKEDAKGLAKEVGVSYFTILEWRKRFGKNESPKRKVSTKNTRVSSSGQTIKMLEAQIRGKDEEISRLRGLLLEEILHSRGV